MLQYHNVLLAMFEKFQATVALDGPTVVSMPDFHSLTAVRGPFFSHMTLCDDILRTCPLGLVFAKRFASWWCSLSWGEGEPISFHELYFAFSMQTGTMAPVVLGQKKYGLRDLDHAADLAQFTLNLQLSAWDKMVVWWMRPADSGPIIQKVRAFYKYGL